MELTEHGGADPTLQDVGVLSPILAKNLSIRFNDSQSTWDLIMSKPVR